MLDRYDFSDFSYAGKHIASVLWNVTRIDPFKTDYKRIPDLLIFDLPGREFSTLEDFAKMVKWCTISAHDAAVARNIEHLLKEYYDHLREEIKKLKLTEFIKASEIK